MQTTSQGASAPRRRTAKSQQHPAYNAKIIRFDSRPRLMVGDVVELCRGCLPGNKGKLGVITGFDAKGFVLFEAFQLLDCVELDTGKVDANYSHSGRSLPENLYRRSKNLLNGGRRHV